MSSPAQSSTWDCTPLSRLAFYHNGLAFKPSDWVEEGVKIIRIEQLNNPEGSYDYYAGRFPEISRIENGDLVFSWSATLKAVLWKHGSGVLNQHLFKVVPKEGVDKHFLLYVLDHNMDALAGGSQGSTMRHIKRGELDTYTVRVPRSLPEQRKIGRILATVDELIEKTEALIAKYEAIKQGMMHDLFTRGVDEQGRLRPTYDEAPHLYKESELGWIPKEWEVMRLQEAYVKVKRGPSLSTNLQGLGLRYLTSDNIAIDGRLDWRVRKHLDVAPSSLSSMLELNDVILNCVNSEKQIGKTGFVDDLPEVATVGFNNFAITFNLNIVRPRFGFYQLADSGFQALLASRVKPAINQASFSEADMRDLPFVRPPPKEQEAVVDSLDGANARIRCEHTHYLKMTELKTSLMEALLSGRVPVKVDESEGVPACV